MFTQFWNFLEKKGLVQFFKFASIGAICASIELACVAFLKYLSYNDEFILYVNPIIFAFVLILNYILSRLFVFTPGRYSVQKEFLVFCMVGLVALAINQSVMYIALYHSNLPIELSIFSIFILKKASIAKIIAIGITVVFNFFAKKFFVFKS
ncbi:MAG: hypothetical protein EAZ85_12310 [Bacteroidetes bacterium]|nr:MAG: hypothetical protein EAZ85_12310 [Bacteroidota bacterium]TAG86111.1 MAG: hypothetical protein EAZ20_13435 [Bacteroidota bacterium]